MDSLAEQLVKKKNTSKDNFIKWGFIILGSAVIVLTTLLFTILKMPFLYLVTAGEIYGLYYLVKMLNVEYEYSVVNGQVDIDIIYAKTKRKRIVSFDCKRVSRVEKCTKIPTGNNVIVVADTNEELYSFEFTNEKGNVKAVLSPNEKIITAMRTFIPRSVTMGVL